ncbi:MAG: class I SAM-dependent methyltransferase [Caldilineaceae bacterium]|nr:class I SAM-dependent methyltransferase [Caldilineaceae bacterium]
MNKRPHLIMRWRERLVAELTGDVLEIGVGEGENLRYYRQAQRVWAIEPDPERARRAQQVAATCAIPVTVDVAGAEALPHADASFDHVVSSLVFCSVKDQGQALREIRRVLKPGGTLHMVEHVRPQTRWLAALFAKMTPWWQRVAHNCHLDRATIAVLEAEGWRVQVHRRWAMFVRMSATA